MTTETANTTLKPETMQAITALTEQGFDTRFIELKRDNLPLADAGSATTP